MRKRDLKTEIDAWRAYAVELDLWHKRRFAREKAKRDDLIRTMKDVSERIFSAANISVVGDFLNHVPKPTPPGEETTDE